MAGCEIVFKNHEENKTQSYLVPKIVLEVLQETLEKTLKDEGLTISTGEKKNQNGN